MCPRGSPFPRTQQVKLDEFMCLLLMSDPGRRKIKFANIWVQASNFKGGINKKNCVERGWLTDLGCDDSRDKRKRSLKASKQLLGILSSIIS